ncbi:MAG: DUF1847 domain-containing protein [Armatimonadetes bacterium]|nr:DUF1847 domain-containing protein [Armatimonadota bacterium]
MKLLPDLLKEAENEYKNEDNREFCRLAAVQEYLCYEHTSDGLRTKNTRVEEIIQLSTKCGFKKLGLAFCIGLKNEARILVNILENKGFAVVSVNCKVGAIEKERIGLKPDEKIMGEGRWESACNPIGQAMILNNEKVDLAILLGLCVGHDTTFIKYCKVPITVLAAKDRVTGHNPLAALYLSASPYYNRLLSKKDK